MTEGRVARRYAAALFAVAKRNDALAAVDDDLVVVRDLLRKDHHFRDFFRSPKVSDDEKLQLMDRVFGDKITALSMEAIKLLLRKGREEALEIMLLEFEEMRRRHEGVAHVFVTSAIPLTDEQKAKLEDRIKVQTGRQIDVEYDVDPSLIGGVRVGYEDYLLDGSVRGSIDRLREQIMIDLLKQA